MRGIAVITGSQIPHLRKHIGQPVIIDDHGDLIITDEHAHKIEIFRNGAADYIPLLTEEGMDHARRFWACMEAIHYGTNGAHEKVDALEADALQAANDLLEDVADGWPAQLHDEHLREIVQCQAIHDYREAQR